MSSAEKVAAVCEKPRCSAAALNRSSARCPDWDAAMRRARSGWSTWRGGGEEGGGGGAGGGEGGAARVGLRYWRGEIHGRGGDLAGARSGGGFMAGGGGESRRFRRLGPGRTQYGRMLEIWVLVCGGRGVLRGSRKCEL